ncbi:hydroxyacid dehydrogenase [Nocardiopsis valliformis]|uniref:hydroxyacid dehydrogenase n=1 Tax=Nocardiopsis valliformis TaxID=239974 RepID=UPI000345A701|nr:hydroxyacid dehydrogenase [Nocardiopsis valliformis]
MVERADGNGAGPPGHRPQTLLAMGEGVFRLQFTPPVMERLRQAAHLEEPLLISDFDTPEARARLAGCEVLLTSWGCPPITREVLDAAPELRAIIHAAGSVRAQVPPEAFDRGLLVTTAAAVNAVPVAEYTLAMILACGKRVPFLARDARTHRSDWSYLDGYRPLTNRGRTVCVLGWSRVGRLLGRMLAPFEIDLLVVDPHADPADVAAAGGRLTSREEAFPRCDVLSLHAPLLPATRGMIDAAALALLPDGATLINTARGALVDTPALERECRTGRLYAVLDVTEPEPLPDSSVLYSLDNVVITPHVAGSLDSETERMSMAALDELDRYRTGRPPLDPITGATFGVTA